MASTKRPASDETYRLIHRAIDAALALPGGELNLSALWFDVEVDWEVALASWISVARASDEDVDLKRHEHPTFVVLRVVRHEQFRDRVVASIHVDKPGALPDHIADDEDGGVYADGVEPDSNETLGVGYGLFV